MPIFPVGKDISRRYHYYQWSSVLNNRWWNRNFDPGGRASQVSAKVVARLWTAKIMTRFELQYSHITGFIYFKTCSHGKGSTITEGSGGSGWALNRRGNPWSQARIPGSWLVEILAELWLAEISMTQHIFCESDFWLEDPGARFPKPNIYSNYTKYYFSNTAPIYL